MRYLAAEDDFRLPASEPSCDRHSIQPLDCRLRAGAVLALADGLIVGGCWPLAATIVFRGPISRARDWRDFFPVARLPHRCGVADHLFLTEWGRIEVMWRRQVDEHCRSSADVRHGRGGCVQRHQVGRLE